MQKSWQWCSAIVAGVVVLLSSRTDNNATLVWTSEPVTAQVVGRFALPDTPLKAVEPFLENDRQILLGSIGSDLWQGSNDPSHRFWMVSDRGPNGEVRIGGEKRRTFPVPDFTPIILQVELVGEQIRILRAMPVVDNAGKPVSGLPNFEGGDELPFTFDGRQRLPCNPNGLDPEGLVRTSKGDFWLAEEYLPSLVHCDADGKVLKRYVPAGIQLNGANYPFADCLPGILAWRKVNRGFEGLTLSRDEKTLLAILQSPLSNPAKRTGETSRNVRLLAFDLEQEKPTAEYLYRLETPQSFALRGKTPDPADLKISALAMLHNGDLLVLERTDETACLFRVSLAGATNLLGSQWDQTLTSPSLEAVIEPETLGITPLSKTLVVNLVHLPEMPQKIEGLAVLDSRTIALANDNDFDLGGFDDRGNNQPTGVKNQVLVVRLNRDIF